MKPPTYAELMQLYYSAQRSLIGERSGNIGRDTLALYRKCNEWLKESNLPELNLTDYYQQEEIARYLEWEAEGDF